jgi:hypothetical protein
VRGLAAYALAPGREQRLAQLIPSTATAKKEQHDRQAAALQQRLKRLTTTQDNLMRELRGSFDMPDHAGEEYRRRIRADYAALHAEHETIKAQLEELADDPALGSDLDLFSLLPEMASELDELPADLQAELFAAFDIQIAWNAPMRQATFHATITDTTPQIVTALLARASDTHAPATDAAISADGSALPGQGSVRIPIGMVKHPAVVQASGQVLPGRPTRARPCLRGFQARCIVLTASPRSGMNGAAEPCGPGFPGDILPGRHSGQDRGEQDVGGPRSVLAMFCPQQP